MELLSSAARVLRGTLSVMIKDVLLVSPIAFPARGRANVILAKTVIF